ncbi:hypothetical protein Esti_002531 [Eimeria stiedai]
MMEVSDLELGMQYLSSAGVALNLYELTSIQAALLTLQKKQKQDKIYFWGRVRCQQDDYYIAYTVGKSDFIYPQKEFSFSTGHFEFRRLPDSTALRLRNKPNKALLCGDPTRVVEAREGHTANAFGDSQSDEDENEDGAAVRKLTEADLLASLVQRIDTATSAVPRGAHRLHRNKIISAAEFKGLSPTEAQSLSSWVHFRPADDCKLDHKRSFNSMIYVNIVLLVLFNIDVASSSWVTRIDPISNCVTLRSLLWPGYVAYTVANTPANPFQFGHAFDAGPLNLLLEFCVQRQQLTGAPALLAAGNCAWLSKLLMSVKSVEAMPSLGVQSCCESHYIVKDEGKRIRRAQPLCT